MKKVLTYQPSQFDFSYINPDDNDSHDFLTAEQKRLAIHYLLIMPLLMWVLVIGFIFYSTSSQPYPYQLNSENNSAQHGVGGAPPTPIPSKPTITPPHILDYDHYFEEPNDFSQ